ncbi:MAG: oligosaccharide flippase family protein, partial [bacterium]|nr:oligosaccharide flippase family protein [bacterium]
MFLNNLFFFAVPELINIVMRFLTGMVTAKILGPEKLGIAGAVALILMYSSLLQMGVFDGMGLKVYALKANNKSTPVINAFFSTAYIFVNGILLIASILLCSYLYYFKKLENILWLGIMVNIAISFLYQFFNFTVGHARFDYQYKKVGNITGAGYIIRALLTIVLTYLYQLKGFFISLLIGYIFVDIYGWFVVRPKFSKIFRPKMVKEMLVLGFPMIVIGALFTVFQSIDRWFIIKCINIKQLGYYSIIMTLSGFLLIGVIKAVSLLTQYSREYYAKTKNINHIIYGYFQFSVFFIIINIFLIFFAKEGMFYLFKYYLLKYQPSYKIASPVLISTFFIAMFHIVGTFFVVINKK